MTSSLLMWLALEHLLCHDCISTFAWNIVRKYLDPPPIGYDIIARTYNTERGITTNFSKLDDSECCSPCMLLEPSPYMFFGNTPPHPPITNAQLCQEALVEAFKGQ